MLDQDALSDLKDKLRGLLRSLTTVMASLVKEAKDQAARDADAGPTPGAYGFLAAASMDNRSVAYKSPAVMIDPKYTNLQSILASPRSMEQPLG